MVKGYTAHYNFGSPKFAFTFILDTTINLAVAIITMPVVPKLSEI